MEHSVILYECVAIKESYAITTKYHKAQFPLYLPVVCPAAK